MSSQPPGFDSNGKNNKSVSRTLAILNTFTETTPYQRVTDIADKLQMNVSTVSRHLNTMLDMGFLERDDVTGRYYLGMQIIALAGIALHSSDAFRHAYPELQQLSHKLGLHCYMGVPRDLTVVHLISVCSENTTEFFMPIGHQQPMYCTAMGRVMLSQLPPKKVDSILAETTLTKYTEDTKIEPSAIKRELVKISNKGYCLLVNELAEGKYSLAAPIYNRSRELIASISVSGNLHQTDIVQEEAELSKVLLATAGKISGKLGYFLR